MVIYTHAAADTTQWNRVLSLPGEERKIFSLLLLLLFFIPRFAPELPSLLYMLRVERRNAS